MPDVGEVRYKAKIDSAGINSDIKTVEKQVDKSGKQIENTSKDTNDKVTQDFQKSSEKSQGFWEKAGANISKGIGAAFAVVGSSAVALAGTAIKSATDVEGALSQFLAKTGIVAEQTLIDADGTKTIVDNAEKYKGIMEDIYKNNYGEDWQDIADSMGTVIQQMPNLPTENLQETTEQAFLLRDVFGYEVAESIRAASTMMKQFDVDAQTAFSMIAFGAQNGLDYSGELLDSINEYSVQFQKLGFSADDMFNIFQVGAENGAFNLDKIGDAIKEFSIRAIDGSKTTEEGFALIGLSADEMGAKFAAGGESAKAAFFETINAINALEDPMARNTAGVNLFGTMWEDLGPEVIAQLSGIGDEAYATADQLESLESVKYDNFASMLEGLTRSLELLILPIGESLIPLLSDLTGSVLPIFEKLLPPLVEIIDSLIPPLAEITNALLPALSPLLSIILELFTLLMEILSPVIDLLIKLLDPIVSLLEKGLAPLISLLGDVISEGIQPFLNAVDFMSDVLTAAVSLMSDVFSNGIGTVIDVLKEIISFINNVFTGNWSGAWENIKNIFSSIWNGIVNNLRSAVNFIIDIINSFISGLNNIQIPDWVPLIGGASLNIPLIPRLKKGMPFVPKDMFPAYLDYGERVLTKEENRVYSAALAMNIPPSVLGLLGQRDTLNLSNIPATVYPDIAGTAENKVTRIEVPVSIDGREVARVSAWYMGEQLSWEER